MFERGVCGVGVDMRGFMGKVIFRSFMCMFAVCNEQGSLCHTFYVIDDLCFCACGYVIQLNSIYVVCKVNDTIQELHCSCF